MTSDAEFFNCTQCGGCCKGFGGTYLTENDMATIANHLKRSIGEFRKNYCAPSGHRFVLAQRADGFCIFFDDNCTIHAIKPQMCRRWPFIDSLVRDIGNWRIMSSVCPGIRADADQEKLLRWVHPLLEKPSSSAER